MQCQLLPCQKTSQRRKSRCICKWDPLFLLAESVPARRVYKGIHHSGMPEAVSKLNRLETE